MKWCKMPFLLNTHGSRLQYNPLAIYKHIYVHSSSCFDDCDKVYNCMCGKVFIKSLANNIHLWYGVYFHGTYECMNTLRMKFPWWRYQTETFSAWLAFCEGIHRSPVVSLIKASDTELRNKLQWNLNRNSNIIIQENAFESVVCETVAILLRPQCVNTAWQTMIKTYYSMPPFYDFSHLFPSKCRKC